MIKRVLSLLTALCLVFSMIPAAFAEEAASPAADSGTCGENLSWVFEPDTGVITISGTGPMTDYSHTSTSDIPWYHHDPEITTVVAEEGVTTIGEAAFYHCENLAELTLPSTLVSIGRNAFSYTAITELDLPDGLITLGGFNNTRIAELVIPDSVTTISDYAFHECAELTSVVLPASLEVCGQWAFGACPKLSQAVMPEMPNFKYFNGYTFTGCAFTDLSWYTQSDICYNMFANNDFVELEIPDCVATLQDHAFQNCQSLTEVTIPGSVTKLGNVAFGHCNALENVYFLGDAPELGIDLFQQLTDITCYYPAGNETWTAEARNTYDGIVTWVAYDPDSGEVDPDQPPEPSEPQPDYIHSGVYNGNIHWSYNENSGLLSLSGAGEMPEPEDTFYPWDDYKYDYTHVDIGEDMTHIGVRCFASSSMLSRITIPGNVRFIGTAAFSYSSVRDVVIEEGVERIGDSAFYESGVRTVQLPSTISQMELLSTFEGCEDLTSVVIPEGIEILTQTFTGCSSLREVVLPDSLWSISVSTFEGCNQLTDIALPEGLETIDDYAFADTASLTELTIPSTVTFIGDEAFGSARWSDGELFYYGIESIYFTGDAPTFSENSFAGFDESHTLTCYYPAGNDTWTEEVRQSYGGNVLWIAVGEEPEPSQPTEPEPTEPQPTEPEPTEPQPTEPQPTEPAEMIASGQCGETVFWELDSNGLLTVSGEGPMYTTSADAPWEAYRDQILHAVFLDGVTSICDYGFFCYPSIQSVEMADSVETIGYRCFEGCSNLTSAKLSNSLTAIPFSAFDGTGLVHVVIPENVTSIEKYAFLRCTSLETVILPDGITNMGSQCFDGCSSLRSINIPKSLTEIPWDAFSGTALSHVEIPESVVKIGTRAFQNCTQLVSVTLPSHLEWLGSDCFAGCTSLTSIELPDSLTALQSGSFQGSGLTDIVIPESIVSIQDDAFRNCAALKSVDLPTQLERLGSGAFYGCTALTELVLPRGFYQLDEWTFCGCTALVTLMIPDSITAIADHCFDNCPNLSIHCYNLSFAHLYAEAYGIPYLILEEDPNTPVYNINVTCNTGCSAAIIPNPSPANRYVLLEIQLEDGYTLDSIRYQRADNPTAEILFEQIGDTIFTFFMPASDVSLEIYCIGNSSPFTDVKEGAFYYDPVLWAVSYGVTSGVSATRFAPNDSCTRAQVVTFLWRAAGEPEPTTTKNPFTDVKASAYYYKAVLWAVENGITTGMSATSFGPNNPCTRGQVVTFLYRAAGGSGAYYGENPFQDVKSTDFYYNAVLWAVDYGITTGISTTRFAPSQTCTRGQVVTFLYRFLRG